MPNRDWGGNVVGTSNLFLRELASALPTLISLLLRIALLYLFFWYLVDFVVELGRGYLGFAICVALAALLAVLLLGWKLKNSCTKFDLDKEAPPDGLHRFVALNLLPIAAVAVATWYAHYFSWGLLRFTQWALKRMATVL